MEQARTGIVRRSRSCVRYASGSALSVLALAVAVAFPALFRVEIPAIALTTLFSPGLFAALLGAVTLTAEAPFAHAKQTATTEAMPPEQLDQILAPRHVRKAVDRRGGSWDPWGGPKDQGRSLTRRGSCPGRVPRGRGTLLFHTSGRAKSPPAPLHAFGVEYVGIYPFGDNGTGHKIPVTPLWGHPPASFGRMSVR